LDGIFTVRAFSAERKFLNNLHLRIDITTKVISFFARKFTETHNAEDMVLILDDESLASLEL